MHFVKGGGSLAVTASSYRRFKISQQSIIQTSSLDHYRSTLKVDLWIHSLERFGLLNSKSFEDFWGLTGVGRGAAILVHHSAW